jgi:mannose-1-phosphate guanylyltransferase/phosphomannomutase
VKVVIPTGGEGSRLFPYTSLLPKTLLPIGGKPVIWWIIQNLMKHGFEDIIICVNKEYTLNFRHELRDYKINITVIENDRSNLGSAGDILGAKEVINDTFLLHYSDELTPVNLTELVGFHKVRKTAFGTLATIKNVPLDVGLIETDGNKLKTFVEKPMLNKLTWAGIAIFEPEIFKYIKIGEDFARNIFPKLLAEKKKIFIYQSPVLWLDIGSLSHYARACQLAKEGKL